MQNVHLSLSPPLSFCDWLTSSSEFSHWSFPSLSFNYWFHFGGLRGLWGRKLSNLWKNCPKTTKNCPKSHPTMFLLDLLYKTVLWCFLFDFMLISNGTGHSFIVFLYIKEEINFFEYFWKTCKKPLFKQNFSLIKVNFWRLWLKFCTNNWAIFSRKKSPNAIKNAKTRMVALWLCLGYAECHYAECHCAECHLLRMSFVQSVIILSVVIMNVVAPYRQLTVILQLMCTVLHLGDILGQGSLDTHPLCKSWYPSTWLSSNSCTWW